MQRHALSLIIVCVFNQAAGAADPLWVKLRSEPNLIVLMRHTHSVGGNPLTWDETGACRGESVLSAHGNAHAKKIGDAFAQHGVKVGSLISSPMCRCRETAEAAFGTRFVTDPELREIASVGTEGIRTFEGTALALLARHRGANPVVFVSHRPNIHLLTMELIDVGDLVVARWSDRGELDVLGKIRIDP